MQNEIIDKMTEAGKSSYAAMQELSAINNKVMKNLSELQLGFATYSIESGVEFVKSLSATTNYQDLMTAETEYATEYGTKVMEFGSKTADVLNESRDDVVSFFEKSIETASVEPKPAAKKPAAKKPAAKRISKKAAA
jgi:phasin family protein